MPYPYPTLESNPHKPGQCKRSRNDIPVPDFTPISRTVRAVPSPKPRRPQPSRTFETKTKVTCHHSRCNELEDALAEKDALIDALRSHLDYVVQLLDQKVRTSFISGVNSQLTATMSRCQPGASEYLLTSRSEGKLKDKAPRYQPTESLDQMSAVINNVPKKPGFLKRAKQCLKGLRRPKAHDGTTKNAKKYDAMNKELDKKLKEMCKMTTETKALHSVMKTLKAKQKKNEVTEMEDQRICNKFCVKNGFKGAEIFWMLQTAYGDAVMSRRRVFKWYKRFKEGREETADNERSGRPSTSTTPEKVDKVLELKNARKETAILNLEATTDDPELLKRVITGDETWIYGFDSETTQQASEWRFKNEPKPKKARKAPSKVKVMLTVFFDYQGIVHHEFQQQGSIITADSYLGVLRRLREAIRQKWPELWRSKSWILHHDNAPAHTALKISKFLQDHSTSVFPQPPYSPDLAPCDFFLFGKLKKS
ncbi:hypothetical protein LAZ67_7002288 [Cordylochernes scorpioides]|uniref:Mos1 transposase HTH domain-containing protein n=1 Tax=Cordylochernes scorpioides TaxID=51811 RepID=A0ABY6KNL5_9ARAC|nr:hypothetical protein LAZ67_7002288 [Cordylochernes scorpioides]